MMSLPPLIRPLDYLRIRHPRKRNYDGWLPLGLTIGTVVALYFLPLPIQIFGDGGLLDILAGLLQFLIGFYIAALAAVATFDRPSMDQPMAGDAPELWVTRHGLTESQKLTRRRFLSLMFGYLALLSFLLYGVSAFGNLLEPNIHALIPYESQAFLFARWGFLSIFLFLAYNLLVTTMLGLYYMTDRIHRFEGQMIIKPRQDDGTEEQ
jgi:hypothetical protein